MPPVPVIPSFRRERPEYSVVIGPCPGCLSWQLDYTDAVAAEFSEIRMETVYEIGSEEPVAQYPTVDPAPWYAVLEETIKAHMDECPELQMIVGWMLGPPADQEH